MMHGQKNINLAVH